MQTILDFIKGGIWEIPMLIFFIIIIFLFFKQRGKEADEAEVERLERLVKVKKLYNDALKSGDKEIALKCGRLYYSSMREDNALTIYDEAALANDLATMVIAENLEDKLTSEDKIEMLLNKRKSGVITEDEFKKQMKELIN